MISSTRVYEFSTLYMFIGLYILTLKLSTSKVTKQNEINGNAHPDPEGFTIMKLDYGHKLAGSLSFVVNRRFQRLSAGREGLRKYDPQTRCQSCFNATLANGVQAFALLLLSRALLLSNETKLLWTTVRFYYSETVSNIRHHE